MTASIDDIKKLVEQFKPVAKTVNLYHPNLKESSTKYLQLSDDSFGKIKLFIFSERVSLEIGIKTSLLFAVNLPDVVCLAKTPIDIRFGDCTAYVSNSDNQSAILDCLRLLESEIRNFVFDPHEGLFVYRNSVQLIVSKRRKLVPELLSLERIRTIIEEHYPEKVVDGIEPKIPAVLRELVPLFAEWAIPDNMEREEKIASASSKELKTVTDLVYPKIGLIEDYLASFENEPLPHAATLFGNLAELTAEVLLLREK